LTKWRNSFFTLPGQYTAIKIMTDGIPEHNYLCPKKPPVMIMAEILINSRFENKNDCLLCFKALIEKIFEM
jgi:hypothetical protein